MARPADSDRVTVYTVAERAGVSVATVSRALQEPQMVRETTQAKVMKAIKDLDYLPHGAARGFADPLFPCGFGLGLPGVTRPIHRMG